MLRGVVDLSRRGLCGGGGWVIDEVDVAYVVDSDV